MGDCRLREKDTWVWTAGEWQVAAFGYNVTDSLARTSPKGPSLYSPPSPGRTIAFGLARSVGLLAIDIHAEG